MRVLSALKLVRRMDVTATIYNRDQLGVRWHIISYLPRAGLIQQLTLLILFLLVWLVVKHLLVVVGLLKLIITRQIQLGQLAVVTAM